ncbi:hypothetical protein KP77_32380 [Jeotgalibacillus alimentarius]|uniref:VTC domain-containing protein n=1 Tax=Jeotgalibacillus alimentarius TaxID=135826 RepID=A0A0C2V3D4_9BACL|nr:polyphosphate polymerase domain-containing protein [Jeotgalibacillus alimentarius]KIL43532.1 hypothetical protein KP77_32380 [Jeotgalibacillus alimentarius]
MYYQNKKMRHELKYYITYYEFELLRQRLRMTVQRDKHSINDDGYHIRSLYFDNVTDLALHEKNWGVFRRDKYRIRIYNECDRVIKLERKSKYNDFISKDSVTLTRCEYETMMDGDYDFLQKKDSPVARAFYLKSTLGKMEPKVIVDYIREAYAYQYGDVRITFDKRLKAGVNTFDIFDPNVVTVNAIRQPQMVLEIKYNSYLPTHIRNILQLSSHSRSAISKYVICREESIRHFSS